MLLKKITILSSLLISLLAGNSYSNTTQITDPQIAHIAYTAGEMDIKHAHLALEKSQDKNIREFAELMIRDHAAVNTKALALVNKLNVTPEDNDTSRLIVKQTEEKYAQLKQLSGSEFDKAYAEHEWEYHKFVNHAVETAFIPSALNAELKTLLTDALGIFKGHEQHAETMAATYKK